MAIKELFYDNRPQVLLDPRASQRIDPRFKFTRNSIGTYIDREGFIKTAAAGQPRISHNPTSLSLEGLLVEPSSNNKWTYSNTPIFKETWGKYARQIQNNILTPLGDFSDVAVFTRTSSTTPGPEMIGAAPNQSLVAGTRYSFSVFVKQITGSLSYIQPSFLAQAFSPFYEVQANIYSSNVTQVAYPNGWVRHQWTALVSSTQSNYITGIRIENSNVGTAGSYVFALWGIQLEASPITTSYIPTLGSQATRVADLLSIEAPLPASGSVYIDARAISANENDTLLSLKNSSNDKIDLAYLSNTSTYDSLALIANYDGTSKTSLPLPVPTTDRERNIITWGAQNYQYGRDSSRFATSLSSSVPTGLNQLSIGHDAVDPTKAFNGYINTVYAWSGELTPAVAEALVRNEIDAINADTYSPVGPAGSLALVVNTQGATASGEKTFTLPAESAANDNDIVITWGDGTESGLDGADAELGASGLTHTYPAAGIYPVWVEGQMENIQFNNIANAVDVLEISAWGTGDMFTAPSTMNSAFYGCTQMDFSTSARFADRPDTSAVTDWYRAFRNCSSITGTFPAFTFTAATTFQEAWQGCSSMTGFVAAGDQTQNVTNFVNAWNGCSGLTSFPQINTSSGTNFSYAWRNCSSLTIFPAINTAAGTSFSNTWSGCSNLQSFPSSINTAAGTNFAGAWSGCSSLDNIANAAEATSFPVINAASGINFSSAWSGCSSLTVFPQIDTSLGENFAFAWHECSSLTDFPLINTSKGTSFAFAWNGCSSLPNFPANFFNSWTGTPADGCFYRTWNGCSSLTPASVVNILDSIAASGQSAPSGTDTGNKEITIDYSTSTGHPYGASLVGGVLDPVPATISTLKSRNWDVVLNGVSQ